MLSLRPIQSFNPMGGKYHDFMCRRRVAKVRLESGARVLVLKVHMYLILVRKSHFELK